MKSPNTVSGQFPTNEQPMSNLTGAFDALDAFEQGIDQNALTNNGTVAPAATQEDITHPGREVTSGTLDEATVAPGETEDKSAGTLSGSLFDVAPAETTQGTTTERAEEPADRGFMEDVLRSPEDGQARGRGRRAMQGDKPEGDGLFSRFNRWLRGGTEATEGANGEGDETENLKPKFLADPITSEAADVAPEGPAAEAAEPEPVASFAARVRDAKGRPVTKRRSAERAETPEADTDKSESKLRKFGRSVLRRQYPDIVAARERREAAEAANAASEEDAPIKGTLDADEVDTVNKQKAEAAAYQGSVAGSLGAEVEGEPLRVIEKDGELTYKRGFFARAKTFTATLPTRAMVAMLGPDTAYTKKVTIDGEEQNRMTRRGKLGFAYTVGSAVLMGFGMVKGFSVLTESSPIPSGASSLSEHGPLHVDPHPANIPSGPDIHTAPDGHGHPTVPEHPTAPGYPQAPASTHPVTPSHPTHDSGPQDLPAHGSHYPDAHGDVPTSHSGDLFSSPNQDLVNGKGIWGQSADYLRAHDIPVTNHNMAVMTNAALETGHWTPAQAAHLAYGTEIHFPSIGEVADQLQR